MDKTDVALTISLILLAILIPIAIFTKFSRIQGISMSPELRPGDTVWLLKFVDPQKIGVGDIILFSWGEMQILHRVIEIGEDPQGIYFLTKGDHNRNPDPFKVRTEQILAVVIWHS